MLNVTKVALTWMLGAGSGLAACNSDATGSGTDTTTPGDTHVAGEVTNATNSDTTVTHGDTTPAETTAQETTPHETTTGDTTPAETTVHETTPGDTTPGDTTTTHADTTGDTGETTVVSCDPITLAGDLVQYKTESIYEIKAPLVGGAADDILAIEFYASDTGSFELGTGDNANYATCSQCVLIYADIDPSTGPAATYFQSAGSITVDPAHAPGDADIAVTITGLKLEEVDIAQGDYTSTPVEGGACFNQTGSANLKTPACVPNCGSHVCGDDGCGGTCGAGCTGGTCKLDGSGCETTPTCYHLTVGGPELQMIGQGGFADDVSELGLGALGPKDALQFEFYASGNGTFDLGAGKNANYATCDQCALLYVDGNGRGPRIFFQTAGSMVVDASSDIDNGPLKMGITGLHLVEVTLDQADATSTPVAGGACIDVTVSPDLQTAP